MAVQVTAVFPIGNTLPDGGSHLNSIWSPSTASLAETLYSTCAPSLPGPLMVMSSGVCRSGAVVSLTTTLNLPVVLLPASSRAQHFTVCPPIGRILFGYGSHSTSTSPSTASVAEGRGT